MMTLQEAEMHLLGGLIEALTGHPEEADTLLHFLQPPHYTLSTVEARAVLAALRVLRQRGCPIDLCALYSYSCEPGQPPRAFGGVYLCDLWSMRCTIAEAFQLLSWVVTYDEPGCR